ncbi:membrane protein [Rhizocola hellebori]|uniref:Membrane protein n=1 Tax=Rhizocola hellebori TaxID=1392758 RepID=A0A8J3QIK2_9ACTN|nr:DMT family transporter [Rhizocola hellebori]GIH11759.1 membrane protein [Rhizocola hellebori]
MTKGVGLVLAVVAGLGVAAQSRINGELGHRIGDGIVAAVFSFGSGFVVLVCAIPLMRKGLRAIREALRARTLLWWQCLGGSCGALLVATQGLTVATIGVAVFTVAIVAGQSISSLIVDRAGLAPGGVRPVTAPRAIGAALCVVAVVIAVGDRLSDTQALVLAILPAIAGFGLAWQQAVNGRVYQASGSVLPTTLVNFSAGTVTLLLLLAIDLAVRGLPHSLPSNLWLYSGGLLGIIFIGVASAVVGRIGVLLLGMGMIAGQVIGAVLIDLLLPTASGPPTAPTLVGAALALVAVVFASRPTKAVT